MRVTKNNDNPINEQKIIDTIRMLGIDMIDNAKSGHPGIVLDAAPIIYTIYAHHLKFDPSNPNFYNRDRFILSAGHASSLLYATLFMAGFDIELDDLKSFRQLDSLTPGHPEYNKTPGVDMSTGPLGEGFASAVGMAMGQKHTNALLHSKEDVVDYKTYVLCSDGDLMEGVSYEAASLAGTLKLNNLIVLYDSNKMSLDGKTKLTFTENVRLIYEGLGWNTLEVLNGEDSAMISAAIDQAKLSDKPTLIEVSTNIGQYSKLEGSNLCHGTPLEKEDISSIKQKLNLRDVSFTVSLEAMEDFQYLINERNANLVSDFEQKLTKLSEEDLNFINSLMANKKDIVINDLKQAESFKDNFAVKGFGGTDFRPAFNYIEKLRQMGEFKSLKGVLYFTDGYGIYPEHKPPYDVAFVFPEMYDADRIVPGWAIRVEWKVEE